MRSWRFYVQTNRARWVGGLCIDVTEHGWVGMVPPKIEAGDEVAVLKGFDLPDVLEETG
jgi:hypothetical protein